MTKNSVGHSALNIVRKYHPEVRSVVDAKRRVSFTVTPADCRHGKSLKPNSCALARSAGREYDGALISTGVAYLVRGNRAYRYRVPQRIQREIVSFDRSHNFAPGDYALVPWYAAMRLGTRRAPEKRTRPGSYPKVKARRHRTAGIRSL